MLGAWAIIVGEIIRFFSDWYRKKLILSPEITTRLTEQSLPLVRTSLTLTFLMVEKSLVAILKASA